MSDHISAPVGLGVGVIVGSIAAALALPGEQVAGLAGVGVDGGQTLVGAGVLWYAIVVARDLARDAIAVARDGVTVMREVVVVLRDLQHDGIEHRYGGVMLRAEATAEVDREPAPPRRRAAS